MESDVARYPGNPVADPTPLAGNDVVIIQVTLLYKVTIQVHMNDTVRE